MKVKDFQKKNVKFLEKTFLNFGDFWLVDSDEVDIGTRQQTIGIVFEDANKMFTKKVKIFDLTSFFSGKNLTFSAYVYSEISQQ